MPLADLLAAIERDAVAERDAVREAAEREAGAIVEAARSEAEAAERELVARALGEAEGDARAVRGRALAASRADLHEAREVALQAAIGVATERLAATRDEPSYPEVFAVLVRECRDALPEGRILRIDPRDAALARASAPDLEHLASLACWGGCELDDGAGRVARNTLEERLRNAEPAIRLQFGATAT